MKDYSVKLDWRGRYKAESEEDAIKQAEEDFIKTYEEIGFNLVFEVDE